MQREIDTNLHGTLSISFQNGNIGVIKESNPLGVEYQFVATEIEELYKRLEMWQKTKCYGIIEIPFNHGTIGHPKETQVLEIEAI